MATVERRTNDNFLNLKDAKEKLLEAVDALLEQGGDGLKEYFALRGQLYNYSLRNMLLIHLQAKALGYSPLCGSYNKWKAVKKPVQKGEKAHIHILAPVFGRKCAECDAPVYDKRPVGVAECGACGSKRFRNVIIGFVGRKVFSASQTEGGAPSASAYPKVDMKDDSKESKAIVKRLKDRAKVLGIKVTDSTVEKHPTLKRAYGYFRPSSNDVTMRKGMPAAMYAHVLAHEMAHWLRHQNKDSDGKHYDDEEIVADGAAFIVAAHLGLDSSGFSAGYILDYAKANRDKILYSLDAMGKTADIILDKTTVAEEK